MTYYIEGYEGTHYIVNLRESTPDSRLIATYDGYPTKHNEMKLYRRRIGMNSTAAESEGKVCVSALDIRWNDRRQGSADEGAKVGDQKKKEVRHRPAPVEGQIPLMEANG